MDPEVSKALFNEEVEAMSGLARFSDKVWRIVKAEYPDLIVELPHPSGAKRQFRFRCDNWDAQPPSVASVDKSGKELTGQPEGNYFAQLSSGWGLCAPGTREYHAHHPDNPWDNHRGKLRLIEIVSRVASFYRGAGA